MPGERNEAPRFALWVESTDNPLHAASDAVRFFSADALRAAFIAGYNRRRWETSRNRHDDFGNPIDNPFT